MPEQDRPCPICQAATRPAGSRFGQVRGVSFALRNCPECQFSFVADPWTDYAAIYDVAYYEGRGADPLVDYAFELAHPERTIRRYEWQGIVAAVRSLAPLSAQTRWLDFGCGNGGLVRHAAQATPCSVVGFEEGAIAATARAAGIPILEASQVQSLENAFDVVTAIEVIEHVVDPVACLRDLARLLKPGGLLFLTTGNARPFRGRVAEWSYVTPEIHVSLFEPESLARALTAAGLRPEFVGYRPGWTQIIRFKVLKNLGWRQRGLGERLLPWPVLSRLANWRYGVTAHPVAWKPAV